MGSLVINAMSNTTPLLGAAAIDINSTIIVQMAVFFLIYVFLWFALFKPYLKTLQAREDDTLGKRNEAQSSAGQAEELLHEYETQMRQARLDAQAEREMRRDEALAKQNERFAAIRSEVGAKIDEERQRIATQVEQAQTEIRQRAESLAEAMADKVLPQERV